MKIHNLASSNSCVAAVEDEDHADKLKKALEIAGVLDYWTILVLDKGSLPKIQYTAMANLYNLFGSKISNQLNSKKVKEKEKEEQALEQILDEQEVDEQVYSEMLVENELENLIAEEKDEEIHYENTEVQQEVADIVNPPLEDDTFIEENVIEIEDNETQTKTNPKEITTEEEQPHYKCGFCSVSYRKQRFLARHIRTFHTKGKFDCENCETGSFNTHYELKLHRKKCKVTCKSCGYTFEFQFHLKAHLATTKKCYDFYGTLVNR